MDSGDLFFGEKTAEGDRQRALTKARLIARVYKRMGVAAINVGDLDLILGLDFLRQEASEGLPLISANLLDPSNRKPIFPPYVIREVSGVRIAFFGLLTPKLGPAIPKTVKDSVQVMDPNKTARETLRELRDQADLVVLLSDLGLKGDPEVAKAASGIHFILGGHDGRYIKWPHQEGETYLMQSYRKGMYAGKLTLTYEKAGLPFKDSGKKDQIERQILNLERRLQALQKAQKRNPTQSLRDAMQRVTEQKAQRRRELERTAEASSTGNRFIWTLQSLNSTVPQDEEVLGWIKSCGIDKD